MGEWPQRGVPQPRVEPDPPPVPYRAVNGHVLLPTSGHRKADGTWQWHYWNATHDTTCPCQGDEGLPDW